MGRPCYPQVSRDRAPAALGPSFAEQSRKASLILFQSSFLWKPVHVLWPRLCFSLPGTRNTPMLSGFALTDHVFGLATREHAEGTAPIICNFRIFTVLLCEDR